MIEGQQTLDVKYDYQPVNQLQFAVQQVITNMNIDTNVPSSDRARPAGGNAAS